MEIEAWAFIQGLALELNAYIFSNKTTTPQPATRAVGDVKIGA